MRISQCLSPLVLQTMHERKEWLRNEVFTKTVIETTPMSELSITDRGAVFLSSSEQEPHQVVSKYAWMELTYADNPHPAIYEFLVLDILKDSGIAPNVFYVSPSLLDCELDQKILDEIAHESPEKIEVRRLDMEYIKGASFRDRLLKQFEIGSNPFIKEALRLTAMAVDKLRALHAFEIVHGDIHEDNIVVSDSGDDLRLIDFEFADIFTESFNPFRPKSRRLSLHFLSPWQLEGEPIQPRDDLYRLIETLARILMGDSTWFGCIEDALSRSAWDRRSSATVFLAKIKRTVSMFTSSDFCPGMKIDGSGPRLSETATSLEDILNLVRSASHGPQDVIYETIIQNLNHLESIIPQ